ncbi:MAG: hypothetical protein Q9222_004223 [Ikaeria aurantiellina]
MSSPTDDFPSEMYRRITSKAYPRESPPTISFICDSDLNQIWSNKEHIKRVLSSSDDKYVDFVGKHLLKPLSTLVLINISEIKHALMLLYPQKWWRQMGICFPLPRQGLGGLGIQQQDAFFRETAQVVAYKVFSIKDDFQIERRNLEFLKESLSKHEHVVLHLAAVVRGSDFYIFLPYTELGSLEVFLCGGIDESPGTGLHRITYDFDAHFTPQNLRWDNLLRQMLNLCGALSFLHHDLQIGQSQIYCAHLDLRPQNVLIFGSEIEPVGSWKISDFGISSFKKDQNTKDQTFFSIRELAEHQTSTATNRTLEGAHRSPENHSSYDRPFSGRKSDMWSFACILTEVLAFVLGGKDRLKEFRRQRGRGGADNGDAFFNIKEDSTVKSSEIKSLMNESVNEWLHELTERAPEGSNWVKDLAELIHDTLKIVPSERLRAHEVYERLERILSSHNEPSGDILLQLASETHQVQEPAAEEEHGTSYNDQPPSTGTGTLSNSDGNLDIQVGIRNLLQPVTNESRRTLALQRLKVPVPSCSVLDWSLSPLGDRASFLLKNRQTREKAIQIFSTRIRPSGDNEDNVVSTEILASGVDWRTLNFANPFLSVTGGHAKKGTQASVCSSEDVSILTCQVHLRDLRHTEHLHIPHELAPISMDDVYPSSQGLFAFCKSHTVTLWKPG